MRCVSTKHVGTDPTGKGIIGMSESEVFAPFSLIYVLAEDAKHKIYIAGETGQFIGQ